ncbi:YncE family protein [Brevundimonas nasdae]|uniref:YncE family protein n=1 Tax=Brevundimonas nasdae TaxID=172043 RepID=UPI0028A06079|nr:YncE family protein [Brevundimonas nasdae]
MTFHRSLLTAAAAVVLMAAAAPAVAYTVQGASAAAATSAPTIDRSVKVAPGGVYEIVFNPADKTVLVAAVGPRGENRAAIARLDATTLAPGASIDVSSDALYGLGFNSRTQTLYGTATRTGTVAAIDVRANRVIATIKDGDEDSAHVREAIVDEVNNKVYVTIVGGDAGDASRPNQVWVIDGATNKLERKLDVTVGSLTGAAIDNTHNRLYVVGMGSNTVGVIDLATGATTATYPTGSDRATNVAVDEAGSRLFIASQGSGDLTVMNANTGEIIRKVPTGEGALSVAYNPGNGQIYVSNRQAGTVTVVNGADYSVLANLATGTFPQTIAIDRATNAVYVTNKARGLPRNAPEGTPVPVDPNGDTVTIIRP